MRTRLFFLLYLNNRFACCWLQIWDTVKKSVTYCTLGGEYDSMRVFYEAGLLFVTKVGRTPHRGGETSFSVFSSHQSRSVRTLRSVRLIDTFEHLEAKKKKCLFNLSRPNV